MFNKVLFATTGTPTCDNPAHVAFDLAQKHNSKLIIFHIFGRPARGDSRMVVDSRTGEAESYYDSDYVDWVKEELKNTYAKQIEAYGNCEIETTVGIPHTEILRKARKEDVDLIVMGAHSREAEPGATRYRAVVGSTMEKVTKRARCPVMAVSRPCTTCRGDFSNIIVGTDFSKASNLAFQFAYNLARGVGGKLSIFHALDLSAMYAGKILEQAEIEEMVNAARKKIEETYAPQMEGFTNYEINVWEGIPYVEILKFAREKNGDLIVMAHHSREIEPEKAMLGSTVEQVVLRAPCPVVSVNHPDKVAL